MTQTRDVKPHCGLNCLGEGTLRTIEFRYTSVSSRIYLAQLTARVTPPICAQMVLIIWDRIFGTFVEETEKPFYGLTTPLKTNSIWDVIFCEWEKLISDLKRPLPWALKWKYIWKPPGWSHDKTTLTSTELREELKKSGQY